MVGIYVGQIENTLQAICAGHLNSFAHKPKPFESFYFAPHQGSMTLYGLAMSPTPYPFVPSEGRCNGV